VSASAERGNPRFSVLALLHLLQALAELTINEARVVLGQSPVRIASRAAALSAGVGSSSSLVTQSLSILNTGRDSAMSTNVVFS
jgi:hypothetical protein